MRSWERPMAAVDAFVANEFVSACGETNKEYLFKCDAGGGKHYEVYFDSNNNGKFDRNDQYLSGYKACGTEHTAKTTDDFKNGFCVKNHLILPDEIIPVIIWRGEKGNNTHCTTNLNMNEWTTVKS
jgi:hypothetical protein